MSGAGGVTSLDGLRALEQAATPGPWRAHDDHWIFDAADEVVFAGSMLVPDDAEFVVAARNALPGLLGRVEAAEAERDRWKEQSFRPFGDNHHNAAGCPYCGDLLGKAEAERDRAEERLREVAVLLRIPDGARYLNDVRERAEVVARAAAERDALRTALERTLDEAVERWNDYGPEGEHALSLHQWLGMTWREYADWVEHGVAALVASVPSGPAAGPTTSKETR